MQEIINLLSNFGIGIVCVAYLIYFQSTTMKEMLKTLNSIDKRMSLIEDNINELKGKKSIGFVVEDRVNKVV